MVLLLLCLSSGVLVAQRVAEKGSGIIHLERHQFSLGTGFSYELGIVKNVSASTGFGLGYLEYSEGYTAGLAWHTRLRYYTNFKRRELRGKTVAGNSGDYVAAARSVFFGPLQLSTNLKPPNDFAVALFGVVYGIQRTSKKGIKTNVEIGPGYVRGDGAPNGYGGMLTITINKVLTKRRSFKPTFD